MSHYNTLQELALRTRCRYARKTDDGWRAKRSARGATHRLHYLVAGGVLDRNKVTAEPIKEGR